MLGLNFLFYQEHSATNLIQVWLLLDEIVQKSFSIIVSLPIIVVFLKFSNGKPTSIIGSEKRVN